MNIVHRFTMRSMRAHKKWSFITIIGVFLSTVILSSVATLFSSAVAYMRVGATNDYGKWTAEFTDVPASYAAELEESDLIDEVMIEKDVGAALIGTDTSDWRPYLQLYQYSPEMMQNFDVQVSSGRLPTEENEIAISADIIDMGIAQYKLGDKVSLAVGTRYSAYGIPLSLSDYYSGEAYVFDERTNTSSLLGYETLKTNFVETYTIVGFLTPTIESQSWSAGYVCLVGANGFVTGSVDVDSDSAQSEYPDGCVFDPDETVNIYVWSDHISLQYVSMIRDMGRDLSCKQSQILFNDAQMNLHFVANYSSSLFSLLPIISIFVIIVLIAAISLIYNAFAISVGERKRQLGLFASVGATKRQKMLHILYEGFIISLIGIPTGLFAGILIVKVLLILLSSLIKKILYSSIDQSISTVVFPSMMIATVVIAATTVFVSILLPSLRAAKAMPLDAIRQSYDIKLTKKKMRPHPIFRKIFGFESELALRNFRRTKKKYIATMISLIISLILFLSFSAFMKYSIQASDETLYKNSYDIYFYLSGLSDTESGKIESQVRAIPQIEEMAEINSIYLVANWSDTLLSQAATQTGVTAGEMYLVVQVFSDQDFRSYATSIGEDPDKYMDSTNKSCILLNYCEDVNFSTKQITSGSILDLSVGDTISGQYIPYAAVYADRHNPDKRATIYDFTIGAITDEVPVGCDNSSFDYVTVIVPQSQASAFLKTSYSTNSKDHTIYIRTPKSDQVVSKIQEITQSLPSKNMSLYNLSSNADHTYQNLIGIFAYGFIFLVTLICIVNIVNTVSTTFSLRKKEFAMLRSVGMTQKSFIRMIRFESLIYGLHAIVLGFPISILISYYIYLSLSNSFLYTFSLPWASYVLSAILIFTIVFVSMLFSIRYVRKENIMDSLKSDV